MFFERVALVSAVSKKRGPFTHLLLFSCKGVGSDPRIRDGDSRCQVERRQENREGTFQEVRVPAHGVFCFAHVRALRKEADIAGYGERNP